MFFTTPLALTTNTHNTIGIFLTYSNLWSLTYFFLFFYIILIFTAVLYVVANIWDFTRYNKFNNQTSFVYITGFDFAGVLLTPLFIIMLLNFSWTSPSLLVWFGHLVFSSFQYKITYIVLLSFTLLWVSYYMSFYYTSSEVYDYTIVTYSFFLWTLSLFYSNNLFTVIFFIEILSVLITLLITTSVFSSTYFYNNLNLNTHSYFQQSTPFAFLQTLMFFFWISLLGSLNLFLFLTIFYLKFLTFDWFLLESVFYYIVSTSDLKTTFYIALAWFNLLFCIFLKCGLVPFYFWKPVFFKGIPMHALFFYIFFFYFNIFLFFIYFLLVYLNELFYFNIFINLILLCFGLILLLFILCESYYVKAFLAMSSILNTMFVFLAMSSFCIIDTVFLL